MANKHEFWSTQPVIQEGEEVPKIVGPLAPQRSVSEISTESVTLPSSFEWWTPDFSNSNDVETIYEFLSNNYVEDRLKTFRFKYSKEFLIWALSPPGYFPEWKVAVRRRNDKLVLGFIAGTPVALRMSKPAAAGEPESDEPRNICEINFLCVLRKLRVKKLATLLIQEITRRVNLRDIWQAVYTKGGEIYSHLTVGKYYHRSLNHEKMIDVKFMSLPFCLSKLQNPMKANESRLKLPDKTQTKNLRQMESKDVPQVTKLLANYSKKFSVAPSYNEEMVEHLLLPKKGIVYTYVVEGDAGLTDFFSFFSVPCTVFGSSKYSEFASAYIFYYAATATPLLQLMTDLLILAKQENFDVCNVVGVMENESFLEELKFVTGNGLLHYYFYNWAYPKLPPSKVGLVMV